VGGCAFTPALCQGPGVVATTSRDTELIGIIAGLAAFLVIFILIMTLVLVLTTRRYHTAHTLSCLPPPPPSSPAPPDPSLSSILLLPTPSHRLPPPCPSHPPRPRASQLQEEAECDEGSEGGHDVQPCRSAAGSRHPRDQPVQHRGVSGGLPAAGGQSPDMSPHPGAAGLCHTPPAWGTRLPGADPTAPSLTCHPSLARANPILNVSLDPSHDLGFHDDSSSVAR